MGPEFFGFIGICDNVRPDAFYIRTCYKRNRGGIPASERFPVDAARKTESVSFSADQSSSRLNPALGSAQLEEDSIA